MNENKYGHLLDKYLDDGKNYTSPILSKEAEKYNKSEEEKRYGDLLKNAKPDYKLYDDIVNASNAGLRLQQQRAEEERQANLRMKERREREERELQERREKHDATINAMLAKKKAEQAAIEQKKKKEAEQAEIYKHIERLMETSPEAAKAYADIYANKLKKI